MPERTISETYAPELMPKVMVAVRMVLVELARMTKYMIKSCTITGVPRMTVI